MKILQILSFGSIVAALAIRIHRRLDADRSSEENVKQSPKIFLYPEDYIHDAVPHLGGEPFSVRIDLIVWSINDLSLEEQEMKADLMVNLFWMDTRLTRNPLVNQTRPWLLLGHEANDVWKPRLLFRNCIGCKPVSMHPDHTAIYVDLNGTMWAEIRTLLGFSCGIDLRNYPMDVQVCRMQVFLIEEYNDVIVLSHNFDDRHRRPWSGMTISEFFIPDFEFGDCTFQDFYNYTYSCVEIIVRFERRIAYHIMITYAPTTFIVVLSWISFWLPPSGVPARVALGLTSLLTLATRLDQAQSNLPAVSYVKAIDVWMFACIFLVSASLLEFAVSNYVWRPKAIRPVVTKTNKIMPQFRHDQFLMRNHPVKVPPKATPTMQPEDETPLDRLSRTLFPLSFAIFNLVYWSVYLTSE